MPRQKKQPGTAVDKRNGQRTDLTLVTGSLERFDPPAHVCDAAKAAWDDFWGDRQAQLLTPSSRTVLVRWVEALSRYLLSTRAADEQQLVEGSQGQQVMNPLYKVAEQARAVLEACERQLGVGGLNASSLGIAAISERRSLADLNARYGGGARGDDTDRPDETDPRLQLVQAQARAGRPAT